jgi:hypothetical protein
VLQWWCMARRVISIVAGLAILVGSVGLCPCSAEPSAASEADQCCEPELALTSPCCCAGDSVDPVALDAPAFFLTAAPSAVRVPRIETLRPTLHARTPLFVPRPSKTVLLI